MSKVKHVPSDCWKEEGLDTRIIFIIGFALVLLSLGCGGAKQEEPAHSQKSKLPAKEQSQKEAGQAVQHNRMYDEPDNEIKTQYPDTMTAVGSCSEEGCGFTFEFPEGVMDKAEVHIFLPRGVATAAAHEQFVTGARGFLATNGWEKVSEAQDTSMFPYSWTRKVIEFADPRNKGMAGKILLGETCGQAVQVTLYYPGDRAKEFLANARIILENLDFKSDKLPIEKPD
jgi:uncharacterized lipoprotein